MKLNDVSESNLADVFDRLVRFAAVKFSASDAEDLAQQAITKTIKKQVVINNETKWVAYLCTVLRHAEIDKLRRKRPQPVHFSALPSYLLEQPVETIDELTLIELKQDLRTAIRLLPAFEKQIVSLKLHDWSDREIANAMNCCERTVRNKFGQAAQILRQCLTDWSDRN